MSLKGFELTKTTCAEWSIVVSNVNNFGIKGIVNN